MRILKKSLALILAIAMMASLMVVNVAAAEPTAKFTLKYNGSANTGVAYKTAGLTSLSFDLFFSAADGSDITTGGFAYQMVYPDWVNSVVITDKVDNVTDNNIAFAHKAGVALSLQNGATQEIDADTKIATITLNFDDGELAALETIALTANTQTATVGDGLGFTGEVMDTAEGQGSFTLTLEDAVEITGLKTPISIADKKVGTAQGDLGLDSTVTVTTVKAGTETAAADIENVAVTWSGYDPLSLDSQSLTGTLTDPDGDGDGVSIASDAEITATVDLLPLGTDDTTVTITADAEALKVKEGEAKTDAEVADIVKAAITKIEFAGNGLTREISKDAANIDFNKTDATVVGTEVVDDTIAITVEFNDVDSEDGIFDGVVKDVAGSIELLVVPAEIAGGSIVVKGQRATAIPEVTAVIPADGVAADTYTVVVNFRALKEDGTPDYEAEVADTITVADVEVTAGQAKTVNAKATKNLRDMGFDEVGEEFAVEVLVDGAALLVEGVAYIKDKVVASTGGSVGGIGNSIVAPKPQTPVEPDEPGTEEPGTEEPGTEEPGTEEPGTEEPGTEEPGTEEPATGFEDVTAEFDWAAESINKLADLGVINGKGDNKFAPNDDITRAEFTKMIVTLLGLEATATETAFADCTADDWFTPYIIAATEAGVVTGVADDAFAPNDTITREQACAILGRALALTGEAEATFTDAAEISEYAAEFVAALAELGIINGYEDGSFAPANNITRAEAAKILAGALDIIAPVEDAPVEEAPAEEVVEEVVAE